MVSTPPPHRLSDAFRCYSPVVDRHFTPARYALSRERGESVEQRGATTSSSRQQSHQALHVVVPVLLFNTLRGALTHTQCLVG